ncbi:peroxisomal membrane protein 2 isoform X2 [Boleophthalmus pectinirostris]|uniref:peroxisomal membrane protein 2 isoform X2 n=1 Tax=Boleophthalmus pectinirostris TaxID=150288 RepID=UPI00242C5449|nr:peroxisomal membrane protein 2 isoform X2 [Boleophthalmus pectinirostris]
MPYLGENQSSQPEEMETNHQQYLYLLRNQTHTELIFIFIHFRLLFTGPLSHYFYQLMEVWMPTTDRYCLVKRLLLDRLFFAPAFLLLFYFVITVLEARGWSDFERKMKSSYWTALKMNWKVWTPFQFVNVNFVPVQFRVLFANVIAFFWYAYLASVRK